MTTTRPPLRERKKALLRQAIVENAGRLFEARGYDHVTVAEIADAADVSVKTLFTYFRSKDDLLFQDTGLIDAILAALKARPAGMAPVEALAGALAGQLSQGGPLAEGLRGFQRGFGGSEAVRARLPRLWADYEETVAAALAAEDGPGPVSAGQRFLAAQLVLLVRACAWPEVSAMASLAGENAGKVLEAWLRARAAEVSGGAV